MAQWSSGYLEKTLNIPKVWGDIFGVALFSAMLGLGRTLYSKFGKNIGKVLFLSSVGATVCYMTSVVINISSIGLMACALTGFCTAMLWPGSLVVASARFPKGGVFVFALMAAGGDLGASLVPQLVGIVADTVIESKSMLELAQMLNISAEQLGMKLGMLVGTLFPISSIPIFYRIWKKAKTVV